MISLSVNNLVISEPFQGITLRLNEANELVIGFNSTISHTSKSPRRCNAIFHRPWVHLKKLIESDIEMITAL